MPYFSHMQDGFHVFSQFVLYVQNANNYGAIAVQIQPEQFIQLISSYGLFQVQYLVLTDNNEVFSTSIPKESDLIPQYLLGKEQTKLVYDDTALTAISDKNPLSNYRYIIFYDANLSDYSSASISAISIVVISAIMALCTLLIIMNARTYRPLGEIIATISPHTRPKNAGNELSLIGKKITQLSFENKKLGEKASLYQSIQVEIALKNLMLAQDTIKGEALLFLEEKFPSFVFVDIAIQSIYGTQVELEAKRLEQYFTQEINGYSIHIDNFSKGYLIEPPIEGRELQQCIQARLTTTLQENIVFVGCYRGFQLSKTLLT